MVQMLNRTTTLEETTTMITNIALALTALTAGASGLLLALRVSSFTKGLDEYGVPRSWWPKLATAKLAGAAGALIGIWAPSVGLWASVCLVTYFLGAIITVTRARVFAHIPIPLVYLTPPLVAAALLTFD